MIPELASNAGLLCTPRVLVVENDPTVRADLVRHLTHWDCEAVVAEGVGENLLADAEYKVKACRCHVALVDMRLLNDYDWQDTSGLALVPRLRPTIAIILSAFGDRAAVREALRQKAAFDFVGKEEGPKRLRQALTEAFIEAGLMNAAIEWYPGYSPEDIVQSLRLAEMDRCIDQPEQAINLLYRNDTITEIVLEPASRHYQSATVEPVRGRSVVMIARTRGADGHWRQAEIIKLTHRRHVEREIERYKTYVAPYLSSQRTARIEDKTNAVLLWDIGAIRYTNIATEERKPLRHWFEQTDASTIIEALKDLFNETLGPWYRTASQRTRSRVYDYYVGLFNKLDQRIKDYQPSAAYVTIPGIPHHLSDPVVWAHNRQQLSRFISCWDLYTHGDLHSDNIFVEPGGRTSVLDFERSGPGYALRDFAELEVDIRLRLLPLTLAQLPLAYELDLLLLAPERTDKAPVWKDILNADSQVQSALRKAFDVICALRRIAEQAVHFERMDEYYWALLMETLISVLRNYSAWEDQAAAELARQRALLAATLLSERLANWGKAWPPKQESLSAPGKQAGFPHGFALLIGVGVTHHAGGWSLPVTVQDAASVRDVLIDPALCAYHPNHVRLLHDNTATAAQIRAELDWLAEQSRRYPDTTIIVYFSGHGWQHASGRYALIPSDVQPHDMERSVVWSDEFSDALGRIEAGRLLALIDACHAEGMAALRPDKDVTAELPEGFSKTPPPAPLIESLTRGEGRVVISSSRGTQKSYVRRDGQMSIFTHHLLEALRGAANRPGDTLVLVSNLLNHLSQRVPESARADWQQEQTPWIQQAAEDFPVALLLGGKGLEG